MSRDTRRSRIVLATLLVAALTLISVDIKAGDNSPFTGVRSLASSVYGPVQRALSSVVHPVTNLAADARSMSGNRQAVHRLEDENAELRRRLQAAREGVTRGGELDRILRLSASGQHHIAPAQVIAVGTAQGLTWTVTIDSGHRDGVRPDTTVINGDGLVGRVTTVGASTSTVLLSIDPTSFIGARLESTGEVGIVSGLGTQSLQLQLLNPQAVVHEGDRVVTFGSQGGTPFVSGVPIGEVRQVTSSPGQIIRTASVAPFARLTALDLVGVIVATRRIEARPVVLPPSAASTPSRAS
jgi:rod shape-determining protein MreC